MNTLNCNGTLIDFNEPKVMGIINVTSDSFYNESRKMDAKAIQNQVQEMVDEGVDIIDIGAMSSRPGADLISVSEEVHRLQLALTIVNEAFPNLIVSIDTFRSEVLSGIEKYNFHIVNDITGGKFDSNIFTYCASKKLGYILMHMQGMPQTMQDHPQYDNVVLEILIWLKNQVKKAQDKGLYDIAIDPGFGFGKTVDHNYDILSSLSTFKILDCPLLVGISRKSMINKVLNTHPKGALNGTTALHMAALIKGANLLRVHDVKEAKETITLFKRINFKD